MILKATLISAIILASLTTSGQAVDSVSLDFNKLSDLDFFKKYSFYDSSITNEDIQVTRLVWSLEQLRKINKSLRQKGVRSFTIIDERPTKENPPDLSTLKMYKL